MQPPVQIMHKQATGAGASIFDVTTAVIAVRRRGTIPFVVPLDILRHSYRGGQPEHTVQSVGRIAFGQFVKLVEGQGLQVADPLLQALLLHRHGRRLQRCNGSFGGLNADGAWQREVEAIKQLAGSGSPTTFVAARAFVPHAECPVR